MIRIDFEYYNVEEGGIWTQDSFETDNFQNFLQWIEDNGILNYKITNIEIYQ